MELKICDNDFSLCIKNGRIKTENFLNKKDVKELIFFLELQISSLKTYHDGISMGEKNILNKIDHNGIYLNHTTGFGSEYSDFN